MHRITAIGEVLFDIYPDSKNIGGAPLNFIYHIFKLTGRGKIISRVGSDLLGKAAIDFLDTRGIPVELIQVDDKHSTGAATVILNDEKEPSFIIEEDRAYDFIENNDEILNVIENQTDCLYFGSLAQRNEVSRSAIGNLFGKKIKYFCDLNIRQKFYTKEIIIQSLAAADVLKLNSDELKFLNDLLLKEDFDIKAASVKLIKQYDLELLAVTRGVEGSLLFTKNEMDNYRVSSSGVIDTLGAGDAFASILCIGYLEKWNLKKTNRLANEFAAEICLINGALPKDDKIYERYKKEIER